jgi:hypothetical protein
MTLKKEKRGVKQNLNATLRIESKQTAKPKSAKMPSMVF